MAVEISAQNLTFVHTLIASGAYRSESEVVDAALQLLARRQEQIEAFKGELLEAAAEADRGEGVFLEPHDIRSYLQGRLDLAKARIDADQQSP